jgi:hypothetical protein
LFNSSLQRACSRPQDIMIRGPESPTATTSEGRCSQSLLSFTTECHKSADTDSTLAPSTKLVDPNPTATSFDPSAQVLADIDSVLGAILKYCADNMDSFTQEERLSFMNEHCRYFTCVVSYYIPHFNGLVVCQVFSSTRARLLTHCSRHSTIARS